MAAAFRDVAQRNLKHRKMESVSRRRNILKTSFSSHPLRHLYAICTLYVRYLYAFEAYKYRTYSVHI
ncbi:MAG: hypothetical protein IKJ40_03700, partial [Bacteroidales bacterium]|nr:hypothetical protein [Bacteroidales bacterium]